MEYQKGQIVDYLPIDYEPISVPLPKRWYMLRTHNNREFKVMKKLRDRNMSGYLPVMTTMREINRYSRGWEWIERKNVISPLIFGVILVPDFEADARLENH